MVLDSVLSRGENGDVIPVAVEAGGFFAVDIEVGVSFSGLGGSGGGGCYGAEVLRQCEDGLGRGDWLDQVAVEDCGRSPRACSLS